MSQQMSQRAQAPDWNVFAVVLDEALRAHGYVLGHLDDRAGIHREKVRRLQLSLTSPHFYLLPPDDLDAVLNAFPFTAAERVRIRAAVLATAVEAKLMDRIAPAAAREVAWSVLTLVETALRSQLEDDGTIRLDDEDDSEPQAAFDQRFATELEYLDRGMLAIHLAHTAQSRSEEEAQMGQAQMWLLRACEGLDKATPPDRDATWRYWRDEAQAALDQARP